MPRKENNKKSFDFAKKWEDRKKERNASKKQTWVWDNYPEGYDIKGNGHWEKV